MGETTLSRRTVESGGESSFKLEQRLSICCHGDSMASVMSARVRWAWPGWEVQSDRAQATMASRSLMARGEAWGEGGCSSKGEHSPAVAAPGPVCST